MRDERDPTDKQRGGLLEQGAESGDESGDERGEQAVNAEELGNRRGRQVRDRRDDREAAERPKLHRRFDAPISVDTWRAAVLDACCAAGAVVGNDISGFGDPDYLRVAAKYDATVVATHIRLQPRLPDPDPRYDDLLGEVTEFLLARARRAEAVGLAPEQIVLDAGLDLGKTPAQSAWLLHESGRLATLGYPLLLSASNKRFIGELLAREIDDRRAESLAAVAYGVLQGCRIVRVHDVEATARVCRTIEALL